MSVSLSRLRRSAEWTVVEVEGEMDVQVIPLLADLVGSDTPRVVLDLHEVTFIDAQGLGSMVDTHRRATGSRWLRATGGALQQRPRDSSR